MDRYSTTLQAFLAGAGSAFALFPSAQLERFAVRESVESRIYSNFARVGLRIDAAARKVADEQKKSAQHTR